MNILYRLAIVAMLAAIRRVAPSMTKEPRAGRTRSGFIGPQLGLLDWAAGDIGGMAAALSDLPSQMPNGECARSDSRHKTARRGCRAGSRIAKAKPRSANHDSCGLGDMRGV